MRGRKPGDRAGLWATAGSVLSAVASSACCWLPLLLVGFGASAAGVATFFEKYRGVFLAASVLLLGTGFYFSYFRKERCAPGSSCEAPDPRLRRFQRITFWVATAMVAAFAFFPHYVGVLLGAAAPAAGVAAPGEPIVLELAIEGMTCTGCEASAEKALHGVPGVVKAEASYEEKSVVVALDPSVPPETARLLEAIDRVGYRASVAAAPAAPPGDSP